MAERYRDLVRPALIDLGARGTSSGGEQAAQALAESLRSFSRVGSDVGAALSAQIGQREGAQAGAGGDPEFRRGLRSLTAYGRAYNDSALRSYAIRASIDLEEQAGRLEADAGTDPDSFREAMEAVRDGVLEEAPEETRQIVGEIYNRRMADGLGRIQTKLALELREEDRNLVNEQLSRMTETISFLRAQDTPESHAKSVEEEVRMFMLIDAAVADRTISESEGRQTRRVAERRIVYETVAARFDNELQNPYGDPIGFIEDLKEVNRTSQVLTPDEEAELENNLLGELRERNALRSERLSEEGAAAEARRAAGDQQATAAFLDGSLTRRSLLELVQNDAIDPARATTLSNMLDTRAQQPAANSDPVLLTHYALNLLHYSEEDILTERGLSWDDKRDLALKKREEESGWKGTQQAKEAQDRIDRALGIVPGTPVKMLSEEELRQRDRALTEWYNAVDALPPEERQAAAISTSEQVIQSVIKNAAIREIEQATQTIQQLRGLMQNADSDRQRSVYEQRIQALENRIRELQGQRQ